MRLRDLARFAWTAMTDRKLRTSLTILGLVIGPATIVALVGTTQGFGNAVSAQFAKTGSTSIYLLPQGKGNYLTYLDIPLIQSMPGVSTVVPFYLLQGTITQGGQPVSVQVMAGNFDELGALLPGLKISAGKMPSPDDLGGAVIGYSIAHPSVSGARTVTIDQIVSVSFAGAASANGSAGLTGTKTFVTRGTFAQFGQGFVINPDTGIFITLAEGEALLHTSHYSGIAVVASSASTVTEVTNELTKHFGNTVTIASITSILQTINLITGGISTILGAISGVSVIVAFIGIMTTMFTTVVERTKEIGVLKALGYASRTILSIFLFEAGLTGVIGGVIGAATGTGMAYLLVDIFSGLATGGSAASTTSTTTTSGPFGSSSGSSSSGFTTLTITPAISPELIILAIAVATSVGAIAGLLPAWRASRLSPVDALRNE